MLGFKTLFRSSALSLFPKYIPFNAAITPLSAAINFSHPFLKNLTSPIGTNIPSFSFATHKAPNKPAPSSLPTFTSYNLSQPMQDALAEMNIHTPSPIQELVFKEWIKYNRHIVFAAQTGTGKTLAYLIPLLEALKAKENKSKTILTVPQRPRAVIFVPNKELVMQTQEIIKSMCHHVKLKSIALCGLESSIKEKMALKKGADIVVATIERFEKHHNNQNVFLSQAEFMIFDEMDTFLDASFADQINNYIKVGLKIPTKPKMIFLSSTFTEKMKNLFVDNFGKEQNTFAILLEKNTHYNLSNLEHDFLHLSSLEKQEPLLNLLNQYKRYIDKTNGGTIIFCNSIPSCQSVDYYLKENGIIIFIIFLFSMKK